MLFYIYYQIVYIKAYKKKKKSLYKVAISHKTYWHPSTKFISDRFSVKDGVLRHWTTNRLPCGSLAIPRPRPHKPDDEPLQVTILKKNTHLLITFVVTEEWLGYIGSDPKPNNIRFASIPNVVPSESLRSADFTGFYEAVMTKMEAPSVELLDQLEHPVDARWCWVTVDDKRRQ